MKDDLNKDSLNDKDFPELETREKILQYASQYEVPFTLSKEDALAQLKTKIANQPVTTQILHKRHQMLYRFSAVAAIALVFIGFFMFLNRNTQTSIVADKGRHIEYQLPDSSQVSINAETNITFEKSKFKNKRYLSLDGEAFFKVKKGKAFTIHTKFANVKVLGTSFDVMARENSFKVSCVTGKVLVYSEHSAVIIYPGQSTTITNNKLNKFQDKNIDQVANWRQGRFNFENISLIFVLKELERQYNVNLVLPQMDNKFFTGEFSNKNLADALDIVCIPMDLTYEIDNNNKIIIRKKVH